MPSCRAGSTIDRHAWKHALRAGIGNCDRHGIWVGNWLGRGSCGTAVQAGSRHSLPAAPADAVLHALAWLRRRWRLRRLRRLRGGLAAHSGIFSDAALTARTILPPAACLRPLANRCAPALLSAPNNNKFNVQHPAFTLMLMEPTG